MAGYDSFTLLNYRVTTGLVSREASASSQILQFFGMQPGGPAERRIGGRQFGYDVFNNTRKVGLFSSPSARSQEIILNPVGRVQGEFARTNWHIHMLLDKLHNQRRLGGQVSERDDAGMVYRREQARYAGQMAKNQRLLMLMGMMRGKIYSHISGEAQYYDFTSSGAYQTIDWQIPSGNLAQLNMLGGGSIIDASWATTSTDIPAHLDEINAAMVNLTGDSLEVIMLNSATFRYLLNNTKVQAQAGTSYQPFEMLARDVGTDAEGRPLTTLTAKLRANPNVTFLITDEVVDVGNPNGTTTRTKLIPDDYIWGGPLPRPGRFEMLVGSEPVVINGRESVVMGMTAWEELHSDPAGIRLRFLDNFIPSNPVPAGAFYAQVANY